MGEKKESCEYEGCERPLYDDKHCIFHSEDIEIKDKFEDAFWKEFDRQKEQEEEYNFTAFVFPKSIWFSFSRKGQRGDRRHQKGPLLCPL